MRSLLDIQVEL